MRDKPILDYWVLSFFVPVGIVLLLNGVLRPLMGWALGGTLVRTSKYIRRGDTWWVFDEATHVEHPWLTRFLTDYSDGAIALTAVSIVFWLMLVGWIVKTVRTMA